VLSQVEVCAVDRSLLIKSIGQKATINSK